MKSNFDSIQDFANEVVRREQAKEDYLPDTRKIRLQDDGNTVEIDGVGEFQATNHFHGQVASRIGIPKAYYDKCGSIPGLRAQNVNSWFDEKPEKRLVRTLDGQARAFLSKKYKPIDNAFILDACLPAIQERKDYEVVCSALSPTRLYLQIVFNNLVAELDDPKNKRKGDILRWGITLSNSEVGAGAWDISGFLHWVWCDNGCSRDSIIRKTHVGSALSGDDTDHKILGDDTIRAEAEALRLKVCDVLQYTLTETAFHNEVKKIEASLNDKITRPEAVVENVTKRYDSILSVEDKDRVLGNLVDEGNLNRYGLLNAITSLAKEAEDNDKAHEYERLGSKIIELGRDEWSAITEAA